MANTLGNTLQNLPGPVLITGHTGFKGTWMTLLLQHLDIPVIGYSLEPAKDSLYDRAKLQGQIPEVFADIRNYKKLRKFIEKHKPTVIIHMAAQPLVIESYKIPLETFDVNVMGTANLLDISFKVEATQLVLIVTTDKVYRNDNSGKAFIENDPLEGKDPYSASKVGTEAVVTAWQQISKVSKGPRVVSVRAGNVIGGGDFAKDRLIPDLIRSYILGESVEIRNPKSSRPWQHVLDALIGYTLTMEYALKAGDIASFNFGPTQDEVTVEEVTEIICKELSQKIQVVFRNNESSLETKTLRIDSSNAERNLNWKNQMSVLEAVTSTAHWWESVLSRHLTAKEACIKEINQILETRFRIKSPEVESIEK